MTEPYNAFAFNRIYWSSGDLTPKSNLAVEEEKGTIVDEKSRGQGFKEALQEIGTLVPKIVGNYESPDPNITIASYDVFRHSAKGIRKVATDYLVVDYTDVVLTFDEAKKCANASDEAQMKKVIQENPKATDFVLFSQRGNNGGEQRRSLVAVEGGGSVYCKLTGVPYCKVGGRLINPAII